jgi:AraC-like DNA-binding protein
MAVKAELDKLKLHYIVVELGEVEIKEDITQSQREQLKAGLLESGLELMEDHRAILIESIKAAVNRMIHQEDEPLKINFSHYLSEILKHDYTYLANLFSEVTGCTIEHYIITRKIETVKELLIYNELSLTEISYKLNYSSVAHLSNQFKKVTGLTPSFFKQIKIKKEKPIDDA